MQRTTSGVGTAGRLPGYEAQGHLDQAWRPWVKLLEVALEAAEDSAWASAVPELPARTNSAWPPYAPLLEGASVPIDGRRARKLVRELVHTADDARGDGSMLASAIRGRRLDAVALLHAAIVRDHEGVERIAKRAGVDAQALEVIGQLAALPLLHACAERWHEHIPSAWTHGYCPICGAWPALSELRGLERSRRLRCGRCAADWPLPVLQCAYCGEADHDQLGTLTPEGESQTRRVEVCYTCKGYLKTFTTLRPMTLRAIAMTDLASVDLDLIAQERSYARPSQFAHRLSLTVSRARPPARALETRETP
ncbi:MAG TPA: formate dehydrogenase accessory protein FdhE [Gemmatimonadaceae bacterium]|nr:formate dehydrogenase accessory protein FdhE [Gemmatimonadaceae bacterium]